MAAVPKTIDTLLFFHDKRLSALQIRRQSNTCINSAKVSRPLNKNINPARITETIATSSNASELSEYMQIA